MHGLNGNHMESRQGCYGNKRCGGAASFTVIIEIPLGIEALQKHYKTLQNHAERDFN